MDFKGIGFLNLLDGFLNQGMMDSYICWTVYESWMFFINLNEYSSHNEVFHKLGILCKNLPKKENGATEGLGLPEEMDSECDIELV